MAIDVKVCSARHLMGLKGDPVGVGWVVSFTADLMGAWTAPAGALWLPPFSDSPTVPPASLRWRQNSAQFRFTDSGS